MFSSQGADQLRDALKKLEHINQLIETGLSSDTPQKKEQASASNPRSLFKRVYDFFYLASFKSKKFDAATIQKEMATIDHLFRNIPLLKEFEPNIPLDPELAHRLCAEVEKYNAAIDRVFSQQSEFLSERTPKSLITRKIELPKSIVSSVQITSPPNSQKAKISNCFPALSGSLQNEKTLFKMRVITVLKEKLGDKAAIEAANASPITITEGEGTDTNTLCATQTVCTFPGEVNVFTGIITREKTSNGQLRPVNIKVNATPHVCQTGFPASCQYTGGFIWSHILIKEQCSPSLEEDKKMIAQQLLPEGCKNKHAKALVAIKRDVLSKCKKEFLLKHHQLLTCMLTYYLERPLEVNEVSIISRFIAFLDSLPHSFSIMSQAFQLWSTHYLEPYILKHEETKIEELYHTEKEIAFFSLLTQAMLPVLERLRTGVLDSAKDIHTYASIYNQQLAFIHEIKSETLPSDEEMRQRMHLYLDRDIEIFSQKKSEKLSQAFFLGQESFKSI